MNARILAGTESVKAVRAARGSVWSEAYGSAYASVSLRSD